jgi:hypothetical protein
MGQQRVGYWRAGVRWAAMVCVVLVPVFVSGQSTPVSSQTAEQLAERAASGNWDVFSAQVTIRRELIDANGKRAGTASDESFTWERAKTASGWKSTMTMVTRSRPTAQTRAGAVTLPEVPSIHRVEERDDELTPRFFNRAGVEIVMPSDTVRSRFRRDDAPGVDRAAAEQVLLGGPFSRPTQGREWIQSLIMSAGDRPRRLQALDRAFGRRTGQVAGLGRYVRDDRDGQRETLVDEQSAVPVEMNVVHAGRLVSHTRFAYERSASGAVVRQGIRVERAASGQRLVTEMAFRNLRLQLTGGQR